MNSKYRFIINSSAAAFGAITSLMGFNFFTKPLSTFLILCAYSFIANVSGKIIYNHYNTLPPAPDEFLLEGEREVELLLGNTTQSEIDNEEKIKKLSPPPVRYIRG